MGKGWQKWQTAEEEKMSYVQGLVAGRNWTVLRVTVLLDLWFWKLYLSKATSTISWGRYFHFQAVEIKLWYGTLWLHIFSCIRKVRYPEFLGPAEDNHFILSRIFRKDASYRYSSFLKLDLVCVYVCRVWEGFPRCKPWKVLMPDFFSHVRPRFPILTQWHQHQH